MAITKKDLEIIATIDDAIEALHKYETACQLANAEHGDLRHDDSIARQLVKHMRRQRTHIRLAQYREICTSVNEYGEIVEDGGTLVNERGEIA